MQLAPVKEISKQFILMPYQTSHADKPNNYGTLLMDAIDGPAVFHVFHHPSGLFYDVEPLSELRDFDFSSFQDERTLEIYRAVSLLDSVPLYLELVEKERQSVQYITTIQDKKSEFFEYLLTDRQFISLEDKAGSISLDLHVDTSSSHKFSLSKKEYQTYLFYRVIREVEGMCKYALFPYTRAGFLKALQHYQQEINTFTLQKSS